MNLNLKTKGVIATILEAFKEGIGGLIRSESIDEVEEANGNLALKAYVKENQNEPNIEELLNPIKAEEILKERKAKQDKVVPEVKVEPTNIRNTIIQEREEQGKGER